MNLLIVHIALGKANPNRQNGVNKVIHELATAQNEAGMPAVFWGITRNPVHDYPERSFETQLFIHRKFPFSLDPALVNQLKKLNPEQTVVHLHGGFTPQLYRIARILVQLHIPYIHTSHGAYNVAALQKSGLRKQLYIRLFEKFLVKNSACEHLIGASEADGLNLLFGPKYCTLIPNGQLPVAVDPPVERNTRNTFRFGYVGRIDIHGKGLIPLLEGFRNFLQQQPDAKLVIIGDGTEMPRLRQLAKQLNIQEQVEFTGSVYGEEKLSYMQTFDALVLPSRSEGMPGVVLEALALGIPCIISKETNLAEAIGSSFTGIVLRSISPECIGTAFSEVAQWSETVRSGMRERALELIDTTFNWHTIARQFEPVYREALNNH